jgi:Mg/Co/Ni transporter MgtE
MQKQLSNDLREGNLSLDIANGRNRISHVSLGKSSILSFDGNLVKDVNDPQFSSGKGEIFIILQRLKWLIVIIGANILTILILAAFSGVLEDNVELAFFVPLLVGAGGNIGCQTSTTLVRAMGFGELKISPSEITKLGVRESFVGLALGAVLGLFVFCISFIFVDAIRISFTVLLTLGIVGLISATTGFWVPYLFKRFTEQDPAHTSAPLVTTLTDVFGLLTYFLIATLIFGISANDDAGVEDFASCLRVCPTTELEDLNCDRICAALFP